MRKTQILIVEDDPEIAGLVSSFLETNGMRAIVAGSAIEMDGVLKNAVPDLVVLDLLLPGEDGLSIAQRIRQSHNLPTIMLTAMREEADRIVGLELGADDYVGKPFSPRELLARIRAVLRRVNGTAAGAEDADVAYTFADWTLRPSARELVDPEGTHVSVTGAEFDLLLVFCERPRRVLSRDQLIDLTRGRSANPFDRSIDTLVSRLRHKIELDPKDPRLLKTVRLGGYMFTAAVSRR